MQAEERDLYLWRCRGGRGHDPWRRGALLHAFRASEHAQDRGAIRSRSDRRVPRGSGQGTLVNELGQEMTREDALKLPRGTLLIVAAFPPSAVVRLVEVEDDTAMIEFTEVEHKGYGAG